MLCKWIYRYFQVFLVYFDRFRHLLLVSCDISLPNGASAVSFYNVHTHFSVFKWWALYLAPLFSIVCLNGSGLWTIRLHLNRQKLHGQKWQELVNRWLLQTPQAIRTNVVKIKAYHLLPFHAPLSLQLKKLTKWLRAIDLWNLDFELKYILKHPPTNCEV